jgi:hypothetical protein
MENFNGNLNQFLDLHFHVDLKTIFGEDLPWQLPSSIAVFL